MNYQDFFKSKNQKKTILPEGATIDEFRRGLMIETKQVGDRATATKIVLSHLKEDPKYYSKIYESSDFDEHCGACEDDLGGENEYDDNGGLPKLGGALAVPHLGQPIRLGKVVSSVGFSNKPASGEVSGMTAIGGDDGDCGCGDSCADDCGCECHSGSAEEAMENEGGSSPKGGVAKDRGGVPVNQSHGDVETLTAGGKKTDSSIASKSVGGPVVPGEGQVLGGKNTKGTIAATSKLFEENKKKVRHVIKEVLKEITYDKKTDKWVRINEGKDKVVKSLFGKRPVGKLKPKSNSLQLDPRTAAKIAGPKKFGGKVKENTVNMKMGPSYKKVQPRLYKTAEDDFARTNQYEPEISEMYDDEEECMMNERYVELANVQRNLTESELEELKSLREKIDNIAIAKRNYGNSQGGVEPNIYEGRCEDYPCCGHEDGGCPNADGSFNCASCGTKLSKNATSSVCQKCMQRFLDDEGSTDNPMYGGDYPDLEEEVNMKMGPSYKVVQPTLAKTSNPDFFARRNQYDPEVSESEDLDEYGNNMEEPTANGGSDDIRNTDVGHPGQPGGYHTWECSICGDQKTTRSPSRPDPTQASNHTHQYEKQSNVPVEEPGGHGFDRPHEFDVEEPGHNLAARKVSEIGGQAVQHRSYRTIKDAHQNPKARWSDEVYEGKKTSKVSSAIKRGMKGKTSTFKQHLKHKTPKKTKSGVQRKRSE